MSGTPPSTSPTPAAPDWSDPRALVSPLLTHVIDWPASLGGRKAFRIRGFSWFRSAVQKDIDKLKTLIQDELEPERETRAAWVDGGLPWTEPLAIPQVYNARKHEPLRFDKAAKVLLLCEIATRKWKPAMLPTLYATMRIEPALFGITGFDEAALARLTASRPTVQTDMRDALGQTKVELFKDMAAQKAVSYRLAWRAREWLMTHFPAEPFGPVFILPERDGRRRFEVTGREVIDGPSVPPGAPDPYQPPGFVP